MELIAQQVLASNVATIEFSGVPQTFRDLVIVANYSASRSAENVFMHLSSANETVNYVVMSGNGSGTFSETVSDSAIGLSRHQTTSAGARVLVRVDVLDYTQTNKHKAFLIRRDDTGVAQAIAGRMPNTNAVTTIRFWASGTTNFQADSTFTLYGIPA